VLVRIKADQNPYSHDGWRWVGALNELHAALNRCFNLARTLRPGAVTGRSEMSIKGGSLGRRIHAIVTLPQPFADFAVEILTLAETVRKDSYSSPDKEFSRFGWDARVARVIAGRYPSARSGQVADLATDLCRFLDDYPILVLNPVTVGSLYGIRRRRFRWEKTLLD